MAAKTSIKKISALAIIISIVSIPCLSLAGGMVLNVRHWSAPDNTRIVLDVSDETDFNVLSLEGKVIIDLLNTSIGANVPREINLMRSGVRGITVKSPQLNLVQVEVGLLDGSVVNIFKLGRLEDKSERLVIDVISSEIERQLAREREEFKSTKRERVLVIDPGHGGEDPGAIGKAGTREKDVVLDISRKLREEINGKEGYRAFLTRDGDYYVPFKKRMKIARDYGADLFVSIHADAAKNRKAAGSSVYCLSIGGAVTEAARILARKENLADIIGGSLNGDDMGDDSSRIILDMFQNNTINSSKSLGAVLLKNLSGLAKLKFSSVQEAPFIVLKLPEIPAVLIETLYISNPKEEALLRSKAFQEKMAKKIAHSVTEFFVPRYMPVTLAEKKDGAAPVAPESGRGEKLLALPEKKEKKGDPLADIIGEASKKEFLSPEGKDKTAPLSSLELRRKINQGSSNRIAQGKAIKKGQNTAKTTREKFGFYQVKKGDSLERIALKYSISVRELVKLNGLREKDRLPVKGKLKVPLLITGKVR